MRRFGLQGYCFIRSGRCAADFGNQYVFQNSKLARW